MAESKCICPAKAGCADKPTQLAGAAPQVSSQRTGVSEVEGTKARGWVMAACGFITLMLVVTAFIRPAFDRPGALPYLQACQPCVEGGCGQRGTLADPSFLGRFLTAQAPLQCRMGLCVPNSVPLGDYTAFCAPLVESAARLEALPLATTSNSRKLLAEGTEVLRIRRQAHAKRRVRKDSSSSGEEKFHTYFRKLALQNDGPASQNAHSEKRHSQNYLRVASYTRDIR